MNILYIAYSCSPYYGSEDKIGWNVPLECAKTNQVFVITKEEHRNDIEKYLNEHPHDNIKFYFVDIPQIYKKLYRGAFYSGRLNIWHERAFHIAQQICADKKINIIHQITPIEFRSIGNYFAIPNTRFVCGPLGGGEIWPNELKSYLKKNAIIETMRLLLNKWFQQKYKRTKKLEQCDYVFFANKETSQYLAELLHNVSHEVCFDNGIEESEFSTDESYTLNENNKVVFLVAGRITYRKGHKFLLDVLNQLPKDVDYQCRIVGDGPELNRLKRQCKKYGLNDKVVFTGRIAYFDMVNEYNNANVFIMPSIRETTGAVLLEAMSKGLPIITINKFGGAVLLNDDTGWLYDGVDKESYIKGLKNAILDCITCPNEVKRRGKNAKEQAKRYEWDLKMNHYQAIYNELLKQ